MKKSLILLSFIVISSWGVKAHFHNHSNLKLNTDVSTVEWVGEKVVGKHNGSISIKEGIINLHDGHLSGGKITINMETITCSDLEGEWSDKLVKHLNSPDFFDVANNKTATLEIIKFNKTEGNNYTISGNLTIKGITKPIDFPANIEIKEGKLAAYAEFKIDRTLYDIKYGSGKFFEGLGDKMISDEFIIKFKIAAN
ncbi:MAG: YceI family protein [Vicingaceae bacterium]|nr:YceI family protein [Vicingaceae bacterium]